MKHLLSDLRELRTIWTLPASNLLEKVELTEEFAYRTVAHHLPRRLAYWSLIDQGVRHIKEDEVVPEVLFTDLLQRSHDDYMS
jgi:hypothetical protein